ncbi:MAG: SufE family protein [Muribaculaceae bacterium]|nr:SufE family protein [Muribaculaceae bacterium]
MTIEQKQQEIIDEFADIEDWLDRYAQIIDLGNELPPIDESLKTPDHIIEGCQSRVWLDAELDNDGLMHFRADSDAIIVKGIISLLISVLDGHTPQEVLDADLHFINDIGLGEHLSPTRSNGLLAMVKQMRLYALAYKTKQESENQSAQQP